MTDKTKTKAERVALRVAEIPDRFSPEDQPEMMLVTRDELIAFIEAEFDDPPGDAELLREVCARFRNSLENGARANGRDTVTWRDAADALDAMAKSLLAAAPADKPTCDICRMPVDDPHDHGLGECGPTCERCDGSGVEPADKPDEPAPADERERRIADLLKAIDVFAAMVGERDAEVARLRAELDVVKRDRSICDSLADGERIRRMTSEGAKMERDNAKLRAECERLTKQVAAMDSARLVEQGLAASAEQRVAHLEGEVERLTKERDEARASLSGPSYRKTFACPCCESILNLQPTPDGGVAVNVREKRDSGWEALERLRVEAACDSIWQYMNMRSQHTAFMAMIDKALASRPHD